MTKKRISKYKVYGTTLRTKLFPTDEVIEEGENKTNYMTVLTAVKELEKIEMIRQSDGIYRLKHAVTDIQKNILKAFGIDAKSIPRKVLYIVDELEKVDGIRIRVSKIREVERLSCTLRTG